MKRKKIEISNNLEGVVEAKYRQKDKKKRKKMKISGANVKKLQLIIAKK